MKKEDAIIIHQDVELLIQESNLTELKWNKLRTARDRFGALKVMDYVIQKAQQGLLRIDVLIWDAMDSRHNVRRRDDNANLQRMYYHLLLDVLNRKWGKHRSWRIFPDEQSTVDWINLRDFLNKKTRQLQYSFCIHKIEPCQSCNEPLIQVADLFAGLAVYSRNNYDCFDHWLLRKELTSQDPKLEDTLIKLSGADLARCEVLYQFNEWCKQRKLGVTLQPYHGLRSSSSLNSMSFWWYQPQHDRDKAPTKAFPA
jgi:hypothetical protein